MNSVKKYFSLNLEDRKYDILSKAEKTLVDTGFKITKKYAASTAKKTGRQNFLELFDNLETDDYKVYNDKFMEKLVKYSLNKSGVDTSTFTIKDIANPMLNKKQAFRETFNAVIAQIMTPVVPAMISAEFMDFADIANCNWGETPTFKVRSNDTFFVTRQAEGVGAGTVQRLYANEYTVNPEPYNITTAIDWYQVASGVFDFGEFIYKVGVSFNAYITQMIITALSKNIQTNITASSPYFTNGYTTQKFTTLVEKLKPADGNANVKAYGTLSALSAILPPSTAGLSNLMVGLGEEWSKVGYLDRYMGVDLVRIPQILLPNTVNTTALFGIPNDTVYLFADNGYKPVKLVFEGQAITLDIIPTESADKEMGVNVTLRMGQTFITASKYGAITGVSL